MAKSAEVPNCFTISAVASALFPCKANPLALSKFKFFPVNNSASSSEVMELSKSSKPLAIACVSFKESPNLLAVTTACAKALLLKPYYAPN